jgi:hypothetical protein
MAEHRDEYIQLCKEKGWKNQLLLVLKVKKALAASQSQGASGQDVHICQPFSQQALIEHLINFIVANNQVHCAT